PICTYPHDGAGGHLGGGFTLHDGIRLPARRDGAWHFDSGGGRCRLLWTWLRGEGLCGIQFLLATGGDDGLDAVLDGLLNTRLRCGSSHVQVCRDLLGSGGDVDGRGAVIARGDGRGAVLVRRAVACAVVCAGGTCVCAVRGVLAVPSGLVVSVVSAVPAVSGLVLRFGGRVAMVGQSRAGELDGHRDVGDAVAGGGLDP